MRLIDADKLKKVIPDVEPDCFECCGDCNMLNKYDIEELIDDQPTVKTRAVGHAYWKRVSRSYGLVWECSNCEFMGAWPYKYCPICGAKMGSDDGKQ